MNKFIFKEGTNPNYLATICKVGELHPIEGADKLLKTVINGYDIVVPKTLREDDIVVYFPVETSICEGYLSANNLYEFSEADRNANFDEVKALIDSMDTTEDSEMKKSYYDKAKSMCGFFNKHGRVRMIKLRGQYSMGFVATIETIVKYKPELNDVDWESLVGTQFNYIDEDEFCKKYIPPIKTSRHGSNSHDRAWKKRTKHLKRFDRIREDQFAFHYDTKMFAEHFKEFSPEDEVTITVKVHGTSAIYANILCNRKLSVWEKIKKFFGFKVQESEYGNVYSSRGVIKNQYINPNVDSYYKVDVWGAVNDLISPYIEEGFTIYGEIVGYVPNSDKMIQKKHDYGCKPGNWKFMPYRITYTDEVGNKTEFEIHEVDEWTRNLVTENPHLADNIMFLNIVYSGRLMDLYPDIDIAQHWHENVLARMKTDKERFLMEEDEPMCKNKVPREGIVIRKKNDEHARAWKLKTARHYAKECEANDAGEINIEDMESQSTNGWDEYLKDNVILATDGHGMPTAVMPKDLYNEMQKRNKKNK
jgi:hypothetical protein